MAQLPGVLSGPRIPASSKGDLSNLSSSINPDCPGPNFVKNVYSIEVSCKQVAETSSVAALDVNGVEIQMVGNMLRL